MIQRVLGEEIKQVILDEYIKTAVEQDGWRKLLFPLRVCERIVKGFSFKALVLVPQLR